MKGMEREEKEREEERKGREGEKKAREKIFSVGGGDARHNTAKHSPCRFLPTAPGLKIPHTKCPGRVWTAPCTYPYRLVVSCRSSMLSVGSIQPYPTSIR